MLVSSYICFELNNSIAETTIYNLLNFLSHSHYWSMDQVNRDREIFRAIHNFICWLTKFWSTKVIKSSQHSKTVTKSCSKKFLKKYLCSRKLKKSHQLHRVTRKPRQVTTALLLRVMLFSLTISLSSFTAHLENESFTKIHKHEFRKSIYN